MPVPKKRKSKSRVRTHRSHNALKATSLSFCKNPACGAPTLPHRACMACGMYGDKMVVAVKASA